MPDKLFVWREGGECIASESVFHGRRGWAETETAREAVMFHEWRGWISHIDFYLLELLWSERSHRGGE